MFLLYLITYLTIMNQSIEKIVVGVNFSIECGELLKAIRKHIRLDIPNINNIKIKYFQHEEKVNNKFIDEQLESMFGPHHENANTLLISMISYPNLEGPNCLCKVVLIKNEDIICSKTSCIGGHDCMAKSLGNCIDDISEHA